MKVKWEDFAKRRRISVDSFASDMTYSEYERWCEIRSVIPIKKSKYIQKGVVSETKVITQETKQFPEEPDWAKFSKSKKSVIVELCDACEIEYKLSDTKKVLINKLKSFYTD